VTSSRVKSRSRYAKVNGLRLHYREWSDQGPPLIFLHGVTDRCETWDLVAPRFADDYQVMAFDLRGHGLSDRPASGYAWEPHCAADIANFISENLSEPAIVVGHSLAAVVAAPVAISVGSGVRVIVIEDPPLFTFQNPDTPHSRFTPILATRRMPMDLRVETLISDLGIDRAAATSRAESLDSMSEQVLVELLEGSTGYRPDDLLPKLACPALVILGDPSRGGVVDRADRPRLQHLLGDASIFEWSEVGHGIHVAQPERFIGELQVFLSTLS
jgi:pimeloyl-ACP methyl ester carboxylesterase